MVIRQDDTYLTTISISLLFSAFPEKFGISLRDLEARVEVISTA